MKKSLIALAALAATASFAQSTVTLSGIMDGAVATGKSYGQNIDLVTQSGARTTTLKFNGSEDLGGGLKANFQFEVQPSFTAGDGNGFNNAIATAAAASANGAAQATGQASAQSGLVGKGYSYIGASGGFGEVQFGTINSASLSAFTTGSGSWGTGIGSGYGVIQGSTGTNTFTRFENSLVYVTPNFNGLQARYLTNFKNDSQYGATTGVVLRRPKIDELGASYVNGPLALRAAYLTVKASPNEAPVSSAASTTGSAALLVNSGISTKTTTVGASYDFGVAKVGANLSNVKNDAGNTYAGATGATETKSYLLTAVVPMGAVRLLASYGERKTDASPVTALEGKKTTFMGVGAEYDLSKRTFLYARYQGGKAGDVNAGSVVINGVNALGTTTATVNAGGQLADTKYNLFAVGVSHAF